MKLLIIASMIIIFISSFFVLFILDDMVNRSMECEKLGDESECSSRVQGAAFLLGLMMMSVFALIDILVLYMLIKVAPSGPSY